MSIAPSGARSLPRHHHAPTAYRLRHGTCCLVTSTIALTTGSALAGGASSQGVPIFDISFFAKETVVLIDFETNGSGVPVDLLDGQTLSMPTAEYADYDPNDDFAFTTGVSFSPQVNWVNDGNLFDNILDAFASAENGIPSANIDNFEVSFTSPVISFGFWVADNDTPGTGTQPIFTVKDTQGQIIEVLDFNSGIFHDGTFNVGGSIVNYGFMGFAMNPESNVRIGSVEIVKGEAIFDDLTFIPVPTPSTIALLGVSGLYTLRRRR